MGPRHNELTLHGSTSPSQPDPWVMGSSNMRGGLDHYSQQQDVDNLHPHRTGQQAVQQSQRRAAQRLPRQPGGFEYADPFAALQQQSGRFSTAESCGHVQVICTSSGLVAIPSRLIGCDCFRMQTAFWLSKTLSIVSNPSKKFQTLGMMIIGSGQHSNVLDAQHAK